MYKEKEKKNDKDKNKGKEKKMIRIYVCPAVNYIL